MQYPSSFKVNGFIHFVAKHFSKTYPHKQSLIYIQSCFNLPIHQVLFTKCPLEKKQATLWPLPDQGDLCYPCHWWCFLDLQCFGFLPWHHRTGHHGAGRRCRCFGQASRGGHGRTRSVTALGAQGHVGSLGVSSESCFILDYRWIGSFKPHKTCKWKNLSSKQKRKPDTFLECSTYLAKNEKAYS